MMNIFRGGKFDRERMRECSQESNRSMDADTLVDSDFDSDSSKRGYSTASTITATDGADAGSLFEDKVAPDARPSKTQRGSTKLFNKLRVAFLKRERAVKGLKSIKAVITRQAGYCVPKIMFLLTSNR
ncbi:hypothetical protein B0H17DRAFT_1128254 [Mycena rosella]|uniref:Uncharacterized protein n=1 Tax=Mycena rosella TaxID=1033263 RepID=A0AAD7DZ86_MYCRO|nr:hypothetical protein B0H17DRAFT_1128254 [Mycena rosella]